MDKSLRPLPTIDEIDCAYVELGFKPLRGESLAKLNGVQYCCPIGVVLLKEFGDELNYGYLVLTRANELYGSARTAFMRGFDGHDIGIEDCVKDCVEAHNYGKEVFEYIKSKHKLYQYYGQTGEIKLYKDIYESESPIS